MTASTPEPARSSARMEGTLLRAAVILLAGLLVYSPVFHGSWIIDDNYELTQNATVQDPAGLREIWRGGGSPDYLPLKTTLQWVLWHFFGDDPTPFHLTSIALHLTSALLLWRLFRRLGMSHAWLGGLLFAVHPIVVESVAWVSELKNTLSLAVLLPAMLAWLRFDERRRGRDYALALGLFVAALLCKASVIMWPVVILLHAWWRRGKLGWGDVWTSLPFFAVSFGAAVLTVSLQGARAIGTEVFPLGGVASRAALAGLNLAFYLWKMLVPVDLISMYPQWKIDPPSAGQFLPWLLFGAAGGWLWTRRHAVWGRATLLGLGFFAVNLVPVLGFFKMSYMRIAWASDHLVYLPGVGIIGLIAAGSGALYDRLDGRIRPYLLAGGGLIFAALIFSSHQYAGTYSDMEAMCRRTLRANPDAWLAHQLYAVARQEKGDLAAALEHSQAAVRLRPDTAEAQNTLATTLELTGDLKGSILHSREAIRIAPGLWILRINLARCLLKTDRLNESLQQYTDLLQYAPNNSVFLCNQGICLYGLGRLDEAIAAFRTSLAIEPDLPDARNGLDAALKQRDGQAGAFQP